MSDANAAVVVRDLRKNYRLYEHPIDRLKEALHPLRRRYHRDFKALGGVTFDIRKGETFGIIGRNGSGKSTLLKILTGILNQTTGTVVVDGRIAALLELGAGFNPELTGLENIFLNGALMGYSRLEMESKVPLIVDFADIGEFIGQPVKMYSSGMFARLAFAVAINVDPDVLIVDEALSVGDEFFQSKSYKKFREFKEAGKTVVFVTHDLGAIIKNCDRAMLMDAGKVSLIGAPADVVDEYKRTSTIHREPNRDLTEVLTDGRTLKSSFTTNPDLSEYGSRECEIFDFGVTDSDGRPLQALHQFQSFQIRIGIRAFGNVSGLIAAYSIKTIDGLELTGTNTFLARREITVQENQEVKWVAFEQSMYLNPGVYLLSLGLTRMGSDGLYVFHRLYDVISLTVVSSNPATGLFAPEVTVQVDP